MSTFWHRVRWEGEQPPWKLEETSDRGLIAVATRAFNTGDCICRELPMFWVPSHLPTLEQVEKELSKLSSEDRAAYFSLSNTSQDPPELGVFKTNAFDMADSPLASECSGLYCAIARLNHSCTPNVQQTHHPATQEEVLHATRAIAPGEELNDCYIHLLQPRELRQRELFDLYGFRCGCASCSLPAEQSLADDRLRQRAAEWETLMVDVAEESGPADALDLCLSLLTLLQSRRAVGWGERYIAAAHRSACLLYSSLGEDAEAAKYEEKAAAASHLYEGR